MAWQYIEYNFPTEVWLEKMILWLDSVSRLYFAVKIKDQDDWTYFSGNAAHGLASGELLVSQGSVEVDAQTDYWRPTPDSDNRILGVLPGLQAAKYVRVYVDDGNDNPTQIYEFRPSTFFAADEIITGHLRVTDQFASPPLITVTKSSIDRIKIGNFTGTTLGLIGYDASSNVIFELSDAQLKISGFYFSVNDIWGGNAAIGNAATTIVLGNLDGTSKIALGASADAIGVAGAAAGFIADGTGKMYCGDGANEYIKFDGANLSWKGANSALDVSGNITCTGGTIGGFTLSATALYAGTAATRIQLDTSSGIHLGATAFADAPFRVNLAGALIATSATIAGALTATSGAIGGWTIDATSIYTGTEDHAAYTQNAGDITLYSDGANASLHGYNWYIDASGNIVAKGGTIGGWTLAATTLSSANITLDQANDKITVNTITIDGANDRIRSSNYVAGYAGAGFTLEPALLEVGNIAARGIIRTAVFQKDVISCIGGNLFVRPADVLATDMTALDASTLTIAGNETFAVNDILRIKDGTDDEWLLVTNIASAPTYTVTRDQAAQYAADTNPIWKKGASVVNYGATGKGGIYMTASEANAPYLAMFTHTGSPWSAITTHTKLGNLNGSYGYVAETYGMGIGQYGTASKNWITIEQTNGIRLGTNTTVFGQWDLSGNVFVGNQAAEHIKLSTTGLQIYDGAVLYATYAATTTIGLTATEHISLTNATMQFKDGGTVYGELTGGMFYVGNQAAEHVKLSTSGLQVYDGATLLATYSSAVTIGQVAASEYNVYITGNSLQMRNNTTVMAEFLSGGQLRVTDDIRCEDNLIFGELIPGGEVTHVVGSFSASPASHISIQPYGNVTINAQGTGSANQNILLRTNVTTAVTIDSSQNVTLTGDLRVDGGDIGITADTDLLQLASGVLTVNGNVDISGDFIVDNANSIGIGAALERLEFYSAGYAAFMGCNVGIGVTPETWASTHTAFQIGGLGTIWATTAQAASGLFSIGNNVYREAGGADYYIISGEEASRFYQFNGAHVFQVAGTGTADNPISWTTAMKIQNNGNVGIGDTTSAYKFKVVGALATNIAHFHNDGNLNTRYGIAVAAGLDASGAGADANYCYDCQDGDLTEHGGIRIASGTVEIWQSSDEILKENIVEKHNIDSLAKFRELKLYKYNLKKGGAEKFSPIAQQMRQVFPSSVGEKNELLNIGYGEIQIHTVNAIKQLDKESIILKSRIKELENEVELLKAA